MGLLVYKIRLLLSNLWSLSITSVSPSSACIEYRIFRFLILELLYILHIHRQRAKVARDTLEQ